MLDRFVIGDPEYILLFDRQVYRVLGIRTSTVLPEQLLRGQRRHIVDGIRPLLFRNPQEVALCYGLCATSVYIPGIG